MVEEEYTYYKVRYPLQPDSIWDRRGIAKWGLKVKTYCKTLEATIPLKIISAKIIYMLKTLCAEIL